MNKYGALGTERNMLPRSVRSGFFRPGKAVKSARGGALEVRRTSDAMSNAARARKALLNDPG